MNYQNQLFLLQSLIQKRDWA